MDSVLNDDHQLSLLKSESIALWDLVVNHETYPEDNDTESEDSDDESNPF